MNPVRLQFFLTVACTSYALSSSLAQRLFTQALRQYQQRYPLVGCGLGYGREGTTVILVGRN